MQASSPQLAAPWILAEKQYFVRGFALTLNDFVDLFTKSVVARTSLAAGTVLTAQHLAVKKPGTGIPATRLPELIGLRLRRDVAVDEALREADLEMDVR